jgi:predicted Rossmann fold flavoprotein
MPSKNYDVVIIGAGAAGLMCAGVAGKRGRNVLLVDHAKSVGEKIRISGGGRCNFTNLFTSPSNFISKNSHFCVSALQRFTQNDFINLVKKHQIAFHEKTLGQLFCDVSSRQIIEMLLKECAEGNVEIHLESKVEEVKKSGNIFELKIKNEEINCQSLVIATGGLSIPKMGATGFGYDVARQFGLKIIQTIPALVPFTLDEKTLKETVNLAGVSVNAIVACGKISFHEAILFTHRGISGPAILQISSYWKHGDKITINLAPEIDILERLKAEKKLKPKQKLPNFLSQFLPKNLAIFLAEKILHDGNLADLSNQKINEIARLVNYFEVLPSGTEGYAKAEVTLGGVDTNEISSKTFEAKKVPNLFFIGEVLDVTGWLGGFNFQWAWASAKAAGEEV